MAAALVLLIAMTVVAYGEFRPLPEPRFRGRLAEVLPKAEEVPGWEVRYEEIASTPEMKEAVSELLNFDDAVFVTYTKGTERISIYIAYWKPGRMSHRLVAGHTPDVCWIGNGWELLQRESGVVLPAIAGQIVKCAERRKLRFGTLEESLLFWHIVGGHTQDFRQALPPWHAMFTDFYSRGLDQRQEQFFVRISSSRSDAG